MWALPDIDLESITNDCEMDLLNLDKSKILITGGTGFFGFWLLSTLNHYKQTRNIEFDLTVLSRNPSNFHDLFPNLNINWLKGDIANFNFPNLKVDFLIHGASTSAFETYSRISNLSKFDTIVTGTKNVLNFAIKAGVKNFLYLSSGAVYGENEINNCTKFREDSPVNLDTTNLKYTLGHSKRTAETLCALYSDMNPEISINIARCFSFVGPNIPLELHYAIGNFIKNVLNNEEIVLRSDGSSIRSYLYMSDSITWLIKILMNGKGISLFNVGSENAISILDLAKLICKVTDTNLQISYLTPPVQESPSSKYYVPDTSLVKSQFGVREKVSLSKAIEKTFDYHLRFKH